MIPQKYKSILQKSSKLSFFILINKPIGFLRDILQTRYFGLGSIADAYTIAWRIPNMFRRILGEGLLNSVLLPDLVKIEKEESQEIVEEVITSITFIMQIFITILCGLISYYSYHIITILSPGALERITYAADMLQILSFFTFFMTFSSILGVTVQLKKNFYIGTQAQFVLNVCFCIELFLSKRYSLSYFTMVSLITANGIIILLIHLYTFFYYKYSFRKPTKKSIMYSLFFLKKFFVALGSSVLLEANSFINISISSYLIPGMLSLLELLYTLIRLPVQVFGSSVGTTSNLDIIKAIQDNNPQNTERTIGPILKIFLLISLATPLLIYYFGEIFFALFFYFTSVNHLNIKDVSYLFFFLSLSLFPTLSNKVLLNIFYAKEKIFITVMISLILSIVQNIILSFLIAKYQLLACIIMYTFVEWMRFLCFAFYIKKYFYISINSFINEEKLIKSSKIIIKIIAMSAFLFYILKLILMNNNFQDSILLKIVIAMVSLVYYIYHF
jgi:putative peptidoglycan lipid II flippase